MFCDGESVDNTVKQTTRTSLTCRRLSVNSSCCDTVDWSSLWLSVFQSVCEETSCPLWLCRSLSHTTQRRRTLAALHPTREQIWAELWKESVNSHKVSSEGGGTGYVIYGCNKQSRRRRRHEPETNPAHAKISNTQNISLRYRAISSYPGAFNWNTWSSSASSDDYVMCSRAPEVVLKSLVVYALTTSSVNVAKSIFKSLRVTLLCWDTGVPPIGCIVNDVVWPVFTWGKLKHPCTNKDLNTPASSASGSLNRSLTHSKLFGQSWPLREQTAAESKMEEAIVAS